MRTTRFSPNPCLRQSCPQVTTCADESILENEDELKKRLATDIRDSFVFIELTEDDAITIRDLAGELLQRIGFNENYSVTPEGRILEMIEDLLHG